MKVLEVFNVMVYDGGDRHNHAFYLSNKEAADKYMADPKNKYDMIMPTTLVVYDSIQERVANDPVLVRERALKKLTSLERKVLGI